MVKMEFRMNSVEDERHYIGNLLDDDGGSDIFSFRGSYKQQQHRAFPAQFLAQKARFCSVVESTECLRCQREALESLTNSKKSSCIIGATITNNNNNTTPTIDHHSNNADSRSDGDLSGYGSGGGGGEAVEGHSCTSLTSSMSNLSLNSVTLLSGFFGDAGSRKTNVSTSGVSFDVSENGAATHDSMKTCSFCYGQHKKHCQNLMRPWPRIQDVGPWHGHAVKDENGDVECPELFKLMCPLCFATGTEAHTLKFCPLNAVYI